MKLTKDTLKKIIKEELEEMMMDESMFQGFNKDLLRSQGKYSNNPEVQKAYNDLIAMEKGSQADSSTKQTPVAQQSSAPPPGKTPPPPPGKTPPPPPGNTNRLAELEKQLATFKRYGNIPAYQRRAAEIQAEIDKLKGVAPVQERKKR